MKKNPSVIVLDDGVSAAGTTTLLLQQTSSEPARIEHTLCKARTLSRAILKTSDENGILQTPVTGEQRFLTFGIRAKEWNHICASLDVVGPLASHTATETYSLHAIIPGRGSLWRLAQSAGSECSEPECVQLTRLRWNTTKFERPRRLLIVGSGNGSDGLSEPLASISLRCESYTVCPQSHVDGSMPTLRLDIFYAKEKFEAYFIRGTIECTTGQDAADVSDLARSLEWFRYPVEPIAATPNVVLMSSHPALYKEILRCDGETAAASASATSTMTASAVAPSAKKIRKRIEHREANGALVSDDHPREILYRANDQQIREWLAAYGAPRVDAVLALLDSKSGTLTLSDLHDIQVVEQLLAEAPDLAGPIAFIFSRITERFWIQFQNHSLYSHLWKYRKELAKVNLPL
jgi:hypothetical protein